MRNTSLALQLRRHFPRNGSETISRKSERKKKSVEHHFWHQISPLAAIASGVQQRCWRLGFDRTDAMTKMTQLTQG